jgi:hypothetical protein
MSSLARIIEKSLPFEEVATEASSESIDLNGADKFSIQVIATVGDSIAHLEGSNNDEDWTEVDSGSIAEAASIMFEQEDVAYRYARITLENDDSVDVSANCLVLVIGDAE